MTQEQWDEMRRRNAASTDSNVCASHDFCDANVVMAEAVRMVIGREVDHMNEADTAIWNRAWKLAYNRHLS
jgi:hypothetical protein